MAMQCLVVDDEPLAIKVMKQFIDQFEDLTIVATCQNAMEAFKFLGGHPIDLIFLDINMPTIDGLDFLKSLQNPPMVIITTAYREYAVEGFELDVLDYLVKPISFQRFLKAISKAKEVYTTKNEAINTENNVLESQKAHIFLKVDKKMVKIYLNEILYVESLKDYVRVRTVYEDFITHQNLNGMAKLLPGEHFIRIHKSYTVAMDKVKAIDGNCVEIGGKLIPIGRSYRKAAKEKILKTGNS